MKYKPRLAFEMLESEMEVITLDEKIRLNGGIMRDMNGNIIISYTDNYTTGYDVWGHVMNMRECQIYANDGTSITVYLNSGGYAGYDTDCHGVSFTDGEYWMNNDQVNTLLQGDGYSSSGSETGSVGDVVVYYDANGNVVHSATISSISSGGDGATVYGQGGIEIDNHYDPIGSAADGLGAVRYVIFHGNGDRILTPW
jgi:hypothetical protein